MAEVTLRQGDAAVDVAAAKLVGPSSPLLERERKSKRKIGLLGPTHFSNWFIGPCSTVTLQVLATRAAAFFYPYKGLLWVLRAKVLRGSGRRE